MRYFVTIEGRTLEVEVETDAVIIDGVRMRTALAGPGDGGIHHLLLDGESHGFVAHPGSEAGVWELEFAGTRSTVEVLDERAWAIRQMTAAITGPRGPSPVRAPMPGLVVRVEVEPGDHVEPGQGVVIVEAMKMENELRAEGRGEVARVLVSAGQTVEKGTVLVEFRSAAEAAEEQP